MVSLKIEWIDSTETSSNSNLSPHIISTSINRSLALTWSILIQPLPGKYSQYAMAFEIYLRNNETKVSLRLPYEAVNRESYVLVYLRTKKSVPFL